MHSDDRKKALSMLGFARRAGKLSMGHDMAQQAVVKKKAKLLLFCSDTSPRLVKEFETTVAKCGSDVAVIKTDFTMDEIHFNIGYKAGVMTVDDVNFSDRIIVLLRQEEIANGNKN
jgi:ribosomal protein L7Ae-like RNA K-turn-binding protein